MKYGLLNVDINKVCPSIEEKSHHKNVAVDSFHSKAASYARENVRCFFFAEDVVAQTQSTSDDSMLSEMTGVLVARLSVDLELLTMISFRDDYISNSEESLVEEQEHPKEEESHTKSSEADANFCKVVNQFFEACAAWKSYFGFQN